MAAEEQPVGSYSAPAEPEPTAGNWWSAIKSKAAETSQNIQQSDVWQKAADKTRELGQKTNEKWNEVRQSEAWQKTQERVDGAAASVKQAAQNAVDKTKQLAQPPRKQVTFTESRLGMTLAKQDASGRPMVSRVDEQGAASELGVEPGMVVVAMRSAAKEDENEDEIAITSYDQLMGLFPAMGRPVTMVFASTSPPQIPGGVFNFRMEDEIAKSARIVNTMTTEKPLNPDAVVPQAILQQAKGLAFLRVAKLGAGLSIKAGSGIVIARLGQQAESWSAPCAIGTGGFGMGWQLGAELTSLMLVLNTDAAVEAFCAGNQLTLGGNLGIAVGPLGRNAGAAAHLDTSRVNEGVQAIAPVYAYSHSKGLFIGISVEGAVVKPRHDVNTAFYGGAVDPRSLLSGATEPPLQANELYGALAAGLSDEPPRYAPSSGPPEVPTASVVQQPGPMSPVNPFTEPASGSGSGSGGGGAMPAVAAMPLSEQTVEASLPAAPGEDVDFAPLATPPGAPEPPTAETLSLGEPGSEVAF